MAYEATNWNCGDTVTAEKLNKLERGVQGIMSEYVPTEWACGDVITAEKLNRLEQAVANAGGGSSDVPTFKVKVINNSASDVAESDIVDAFVNLLYVSTYGAMMPAGYESALEGIIYAGTEKDIVFTYYEIYGAYIDVPNNLAYSYSDLTNIQGDYGEDYNTFSVTFESFQELADAYMVITIS